MKKLYIFLFLSLSVSAYCQYEIKSKYLTEPLVAKEFVVEVADFYRAVKDDNGGYYTFINRDGSPAAGQNPWPGYNRKSLCSISRVAYAFNKAFMVSGDISYLQDARHALKLLYAKGWDETNRGWYFTYNVDDDKAYGPYWNEDNKWTFQQEYALVGIISTVEATGGEVDWDDEGSALSDLEWFQRGENILTDEVWDTRSDYLGYYEEATRAWGNKSGKGFTGTIDGINTHAAIATLMWPDNENYSERFKDLSDIARDRLAGNMDVADVNAGFPEQFDADWNIDYDKTETGIGHMIKTAWCLGRAAIVFEDNSYAESARKILDHVMESGSSTHDDLYDHVNGGPFELINWNSGEVIGTNKNHWVLEQGLTGGLINYYLATNQEQRDRYLKLADESIDFFETYLVDKQYGTSFLSSSSDGSRIVNGNKGDDFKAGFHDAELGYYSYLYGQAYLHNQPFELYYYFQPKTYPQSFSLKPLAIADSDLYISKVTLDGENYNDFYPNERQLQIDQGVGGVFKVEFTPRNISTALSKTFQNAIDAQSYPNPASSFVNVRFGVQASSSVIISVFDLTGRSLLQFNLGEKHSGSHEFRINLSDINWLQQGVYVVQVKTDSEVGSTKVVYKP